MKISLKNTIFKFSMVTLSATILSTTSIGGTLKSNAQSNTSNQTTQNIVDNNSEQDHINTTVVNSNEKWNDFQNEINNINSQNLNQNEKKEQLQQIMQQYNGAEATFNVESQQDEMFKSFAPAPHVTEKIVNGGLNDFADTSKGIENLRTYYGQLHFELDSIGTITGAETSGPLGAFVGGFVSEKWLGSSTKEAQNSMKTMINKHKKKGGCRITATDVFPIAYLSSQNEMPL